jgi:hypothetical protein
MQRHGKVAEEKPQESGHMKWWMSVGVLALVAVCAFIGITLWLGLNMEGEGSSKTVIKNANFNEEKIPSATGTEKQAVLGAANQKINEDSQHEGSDGKGTTKKQYSELEVATATDSVDKDLGEDAYVEEVHKSQTASDEQSMATGNAVVHRKGALTSGSPLHPQPIPETPAVVPSDPTAGETATPTTDGYRRHRYPEYGTTASAPSPSSTGVATQGEQAFSKPERTSGELLYTDVENNPLSSEEGTVSAFLSEGNKKIRHFDISDVVNERGEHFMPQNFDYPHDRDYVPSQQFDDAHVTERGHEIADDGADRDGFANLDRDDGLFYSPSNPERYDGEDPDLADNPFTTFLQGRLQELYSWLSTDEDLAGKQNTDIGTLSGDFMKVLVALNRSLNEGNASILLGELKDMYYNESTLNVTDPAVLHNSSNMVSFGLLAFDLLLLRNVQQIAWEEEKLSSEEMLKDPEVLALNALFMPPERVRQLQVGRRTDGQAARCMQRVHLAQNWYRWRALGNAMKAEIVRLVE